VKKLNEIHDEIKESKRKRKRKMVYNAAQKPTSETKTKV